MPLSEGLMAAINIRLRPDVPVGSLLSGGLDSSLIVGVINDLKGLNGFEAYSADFLKKTTPKKNILTRMLAFWNSLLIISIQHWIG